MTPSSIAGRPRRPSSCLPAFHDRLTTVGEQVFAEFGRDSVEVTDEVFSSDAPVATLV